MEMEHEYLLGYGTLGDVGRFRAPAALACRRGDRAVIRTSRGVEIGEVLCESPADPRFLSGLALGELLRRASDDDEHTAESLRRRTDDFCEEAALQAAALGLPLAVLDAEMLFDGEHVVLHFVRWEDCDIRPLVSSLSKAFALRVLVQDLTSADSHGCGSCGSGGCGTGGCGSGCGSASTEDVRAYFAGLREQMQLHQRVPLL